MTTEQRKAIFGISKGLGMSNDELHIMVSGLTGCESIKDLDDKQTDIVLQELRYRDYVNKSEYTPKVDEEIYPGKMTAEQRKYARGLMRKLERLDEKPRLHENGKPYTTEERLAGAINKILGITAMPNKRVFNWLTVAEGSKLIEGLKRYVRSAERKAEKRKNENRSVE